MERPLLFVAASGLAREAAAAARATGREVLGCLDDDPALRGREVAPGLPVLGGLDDVGDYDGADLVVCAGKGVVRELIVARLDALGVASDRYATVVHPHTAINPDTVIGHGSILLAGVVATAQVSLGDHVVCMPNVVLTHDDQVDSFATLCAGVVLGGSVRVGRAAYVGMAASVREGINVGERSVIGMGSAVVRDVAERQTVIGVPARLVNHAEPAGEASR